MSALAHFADLNRTSTEVREVPKPAVSRCSKMQAHNPILLDHLVGDGEQLVRDVEAERLSGLDVDHQLELRR